MPIIEKRRLQLKLKKLRYDLVVDIRNTVFPLLIGPKYRTATIQKIPRSLLHKRERHLYRLKSLGIDNLEELPFIHITKEDEAHVEKLIKENGILDPIVVVNPGAKSHLKRWTAEGFSEVADRGGKLILISSGGTVYGEAVKLPIYRRVPILILAP